MDHQTLFRDRGDPGQELNAGTSLVLQALKPSDHGLGHAEGVGQLGLREPCLLSCHLDLAGNGDPQPGRSSRGLNSRSLSCPLMISSIDRRSLSRCGFFFLFMTAFIERGLYESARIMCRANGTRVRIFSKSRALVVNTVAPICRADKAMRTSWENPAFFLPVSPACH